MKKTLTTFAILCSLTVFGQTTEEHLQNGISKQLKNIYKMAFQNTNNRTLKEQ